MISNENIFSIFKFYFLKVGCSRPFYIKMFYIEKSLDAIKRYNQCFSLINTFGSWVAMLIHYAMYCEVQL